MSSATRRTRILRDDDTFKRIRGSGGEILVRVELQRQLPVGLLQILIAGALVDAQDLIEVPAVLYPAGSPQNACQNKRN